jgi:hypothetical protein
MVLSAAEARDGGGSSRAHFGCETFIAAAASKTGFATAEPDSATAEPDSTTAEPDSATAEPDSATAEDAATAGGGVGFGFAFFFGGIASKAVGTGDAKSTDKTTVRTANDTLTYAIEYIITHMHAKEMMEGWWQIVRTTRHCSTN